MRIGVLLSVAMVVFGVLPVQGQSLAEREAALKAAVPFSEMARDVPGLTRYDYNDAVRKVARDQWLSDLRTPSTPTPPPMPRNRTAYYSDADGVTGTATQLGGPFTYYNFSDATSATTTRIDPFTFYDINQNGSSTTGTTTTIGDVQFHHFSNGVNGTSTQIGQFGFHTFSDGTNCTTTRIGQFVYTNC